MGDEKRKCDAFDETPLQIWFKFGVYESCTEAEYQAAVSRIREAAG